MRIMITTVALGLGLLLTAPAPVAAQPLDPFARRGGGGKLRQKIARRIQLIRMNAIITALALTPKQAPKFFAVAAQYEKKLKKIRSDSHKRMRQLGQMVRSGSYKAAKINQHAAQLMKNQVRVKQLELQRFGAIRKIITAQQLAKLLIALPRIEQRIRRLIRRAQRRRGGGWNTPLVGP